MPRRGRSSGRSSGGGGFFGRTNQKPQTQTKSSAASSRSAPAPAASPNAAPPAPMQPSGGMGGGLLGTVMQGMAFGTGSAIAHRTVDAVAGPRTVQVDHSEASASNPNSAAPRNCQNDAEKFNQCMADNQGSVGACQFYFDMLSQCQKM